MEFVCEQRSSSMERPNFYQYKIDRSAAAPEETGIANIGSDANKIVIDRSKPLPFRQYTSRSSKSKSSSSKFEIVDLGYRSQHQIKINDRTWFYRLVQSVYGKRSLMDYYSLDQIANHLVVCYTPEKLPGQTKPFLTKRGTQGRLFSLFDSYLEFYQYMKKIESKDRCFYELIFGELPQKPHFDIDIDHEDAEKQYPDENVVQLGESLIELIIFSCIEVLKEYDVEISIEKDILLYTTHSNHKQSYHLIINNKCHDGNREAQEFCKLVVQKISTITNGKYVEFIDKKVYSPRQQFRIIGNQKVKSGLVKIFHETFVYNGKKYTHIYNEDAIDPSLKLNIILYESLISFTSGCSYLPYFVKPTDTINTFNYNDSSYFTEDLDNLTYKYCIELLHKHFDPSFFSIQETRGKTIFLKREKPSFCSICNRVHKAENPFLIILSNKLYFDCRRSGHHRNGERLLLGIIGFSISELQKYGNYDDLDDPEEYTSCPSSPSPSSHCSQPSSPSPSSHFSQSSPSSSHSTRCSQPIKSDEQVFTKLDIDYNLLKQPVDVLSKYQREKIQEQFQKQNFSYNGCLQLTKSQNISDWSPGL